MSIYKASSQHEAFYQAAMAALQAVIKKHPEIRTLEVIACLGRALGYSIAMCFPDERDVARLTAIQNMDQATRDVAAAAPIRAGVQQDPPKPPPADRSQRAMLSGRPETPDHRELGPDGMQKDYVVLSAEERAKGFVRPVRRTYRHATCGATTTMGLALAETYARDPGFYSGTFCAVCRHHYPLNEFTWEGTDETLGS